MFYKRIKIDSFDPYKPIEVDAFEHYNQISSNSNVIWNILVRLGIPRPICIFCTMTSKTEK